MKIYKTITHYDTQYSFVFGSDRCYYLMMSHQSYVSLHRSGVRWKKDGPPTWGVPITMVSWLEVLVVTGKSRKEILMEMRGCKRK